MDGARDIEPIASDEPNLLPRHVRRALAHLHDNLADKVTLSEVASVCAVPERTLLKQFQKFLGLPPLAYLRRLRLNAARSRLTEAESKDAIADIAISCGFAHLGRFATEYRRAFGETPSATRQRARDRVADAAAAERRAARATEDAASLPAPIVWREKPSLLILPLHTETSQACREARDLTERLGATLSRMRIATVTLAYPSYAPSMRVRQPRNAGTQYALRGRLTRDGERTRVIIRLIDVVADSTSGATASTAPRATHSRYRTASWMTCCAASCRVSQMPRSNVCAARIPMTVRHVTSQCRRGHSSSAPACRVH